MNPNEYFETEGIIFGEINSKTIIVKAKTTKKYEKLPENTPVAIKIIKIKTPYDSGHIQREINILKNLSSLNNKVEGIICYYDSFKFEYDYYIITEYVDGSTLEHLIRSLLEDKGNERIY